MPHLDNNRSASNDAARELLALEDPGMQGQDAAHIQMPDAG
jgi:hypothetical protein